MFLNNEKHCSKFLKYFEIKMFMAKEQEKGEMVIHCDKKKLNILLINEQ